MKLKMKRLISVLMIAMMAVMVVGCGDDSKPTTSDNAKPEATATAAPEENQETKEPEAEPAEEKSTKKTEASTAMRLVGGEDLLKGTSNIDNESNDDGSYFSHDESDDGMLAVYQQGGIALPGEDVTEEEYALNMATGLCSNGANDDARIKPSNEYSANVSHPVYVASFTSGGNEDTAQWWVYVAYTDNGLYLFGICTPIDAEPDAGALADETFPKLKLG